MSEVICVLPTWSGDQSMAIRLLRWISELGRVNTHCVVLCSDKCDVKQLMRCAEDAFLSAEWCQDREEVTSDWSGEWEGNKSALGPNSLWNQSAWGAYMKWKKPFLFLEPDSCPLARDWFEVLKAEYLACGKPMMGALIVPTSDRNAKHLSGVSIYDHRLPQYVPEMVDYKLGGVAFDMAAPAKTLSFSHITKRIVDVFRCPTFKSQADYSARIPDGAVLFHANKDGSLISLVRERMRQPAVVPVSKLEKTQPIPHGMGETIGELVAPAPVVDIVIKSYPKDYAMLGYALMSIHKFVTGWRKIVLMVPEPVPYKEVCPDIDRDRIDVHLVSEVQPGYLLQQSLKMTADKYTTAPWILHHDSDCVFTRPLNVSELFINGKPYWLKTPYGDARPDQQIWRPIQEAFVGRPASFEMMRRHDFLTHRSWLEKVREFCFYKHGQHITEYIMGLADPGNGLALTFSEWNCLGHFLHEFHPDLVHWIDTTRDEVPEAYIYQGFTHGGPERIQQDIAKFRQILDLWSDTPNLIKHDTAASPTPEPEKLPVDIKIVLDWLKQEAAKSGLHKARLVKAISGALNESKPKAGPAKQRGKAHDRTGDKLAKAKPDQGYLLCVHTFPGANEGLARHWSAFQSAGAAEIVVITTTDGGCKVPEGAKEVQIGANKYISGAHLPQRLVDTLEFCLSTPYNRYAIAEWDCLILKPLEFTKTSLYMTGGQVPGASAPQFFHSPWLLTREDARLLIAELRQIIQEGHCRAGKPDCSPDLALGLAVHRLGLKYEPLNIYSRNNLNEPGTLEIACQKAREGVVAVHGCKTPVQFNAIMAAATLNKTVSGGS